jgi:hypothetical protein
VPGTPKGFTPSAVPCSFDLRIRRAVDVTFSSRVIRAAAVEGSDRMAAGYASRRVALAEGRTADNAVLSTLVCARP